MDESEATAPRNRRPVLVTAVAVGTLTMGATFAGSVVNLLTGTAAIALAAAGAVMAGMASIIAMTISGPAAESAERRAPAVWTWPDMARHPLEAVRNIRLPLACTLAIAGALTVPDRILASIPLQGLAAEHVAILLPATAGAWSLLIAMIAQGWNLDFKERQRGAGLDALITYSGAAAVGLWAGTVGEPYLGFFLAAAAMFVLTAVAGRFEDDFYENGPIPLLLSTAGIAGASLVAASSGASPFGVVVAGAGVLAAVTLPAAVRDDSSEFPVGILEFVPFAVLAVMGVTLDFWWFAPAVLVFAAAVANASGGNHDAPEIKQGAAFVARWFGPLKRPSMTLTVLIALASLYLAAALAFPTLNLEFP